MLLLRSCCSLHCTPQTPYHVIQHTAAEYRHYLKHTRAHGLCTHHGIMHSYTFPSHTVKTDLIELFSTIIHWRYFQQCTCVSYIPGQRIKASNTATAANSVAIYTRTLTLACESSTSAGRSHLFPTSSLTASGQPLCMIYILLYIMCMIYLFMCMIYFHRQKGWQAYLPFWCVDSIHPYCLHISERPRLGYIKEKDDSICFSVVNCWNRHVLFWACCVPDFDLCTYIHKNKKGLKWWGVFVENSVPTLIFFPFKSISLR